MKWKEITIRPTTSNKPQTRSKSHFFSYMPFFNLGGGGGGEAREMFRNKCIQKHIVNEYQVNLITVVITEVDTKKIVPATAIKCNLYPSV